MDEEKRTNAIIRFGCMNCNLVSDFFYIGKGQWQCGNCKNVIMEDDYHE